MPSSEGSENVRVLVYDPYRSSRANTCRILTEKGYANTFDTDDFEKVASLMGRNDVDMVLASVDREAMNYWHLMRRLRQGRAVRNRFIISMVMLAEPSENKIRAMIDAGVDSVQTKPLVVDELKNRLTFFRNSRAPFVVTRDYVGPDRRHPPRPGGEPAPLIEAPNPVKLMADGHTTRAEYNDLAARVSTALDNRSAASNGHQLVWLADHILHAFLQDKVDTKALNLIDQLVRVSSQMPTRLEGTPYAPAVPLCQQVQILARDLRSDPDNPTRKNLELLPELSRAIDRYFDAPLADLSIAQAISKTVTEYSGTRRHAG